jgi:hypothetical protein
MSAIVNDEDDDRVIECARGIVLELHCGPHNFPYAVTFGYSCSYRFSDPPALVNGRRKAAKQKAAEKAKIAQRRLIHYSHRPPSSFRVQLSRIASVSKLPPNAKPKKHAQLLLLARVAAKQHYLSLS